ncbi:MAG: hypothetical protein SFU98_09750 [Leptospiraceae bacterium]|nr:hypothetical protein [Leptospiraceae bacterium]
MQLGDGTQKIAQTGLEPTIYVRPIFTYNPIPPVMRVYSNENFFNQEAFKEFKNGRFFRETGETKKDFVQRGAILDFVI